MRKPLILTLVFIGSMALGVVLLLLITTGIGFIQMAIQQHNHPGIGAVAGSISELSVLLVPLLCGVIAFLSPSAKSNAENNKQHPVSSRHLVKMEY